MLSKMKGSDITDFLKVGGCGVFVCGVKRVETVVRRDLFSDRRLSTSRLSPWTISYILRIGSWFTAGLESIVVSSYSFVLTLFSGRIFRRGVRAVSFSEGFVPYLSARDSCCIFQLDACAVSFGVIVS